MSGVDQQGSPAVLTGSTVMTPKKCAAGTKASTELRKGTLAGTWHNTPMRQSEKTHPQTRRVPVEHCGSDRGPMVRIWRDSSDWCGGCAWCCSSWPYHCVLYNNVVGTVLGLVLDEKFMFVCIYV